MAAKRGGGRIKTVVYLDVLLLTNFLTAYLLLLAAGALVFLAGMPTKRTE